MKWSLLLHTIAVIAGVLSLVALIVFWITSAQEGIRLFSSEHVWKDVVGLALVSITFGIGTMIHRSLEEEREWEEIEEEVKEGFGE